MADFKFKQFTVAQDQCAMKVGTDGVLLGAWAKLNNQPNTALDIGTGTGVIALMLAQRSHTLQIDALELDEDAYEQAVANFEDSNWGDRLFCYHAHLYEFAIEIDEQYDLICCNPPFFKEDQKSSSTSRNKARFEDAMPFELLTAAVHDLLSSEGIFCVILPRQREKEFICLAAKVDLTPTHITRVKGNKSVDAKRSLMAFKKTLKPDHTVIFDELVIEKSRHDYTLAYKQLVKDFYLKM